MRSWHATIRYLDTHQVERVWETTVEAETAKAAGNSAERKLHRERQDILASMDPDVEPLDQAAPAHDPR